MAILELANVQGDVSAEGRLVITPAEVALRLTYREGEPRRGFTPADSAGFWFVRKRGRASSTRPRPC